MSDTSLNIVIPMAGLGQRFASVGYTDPKPLIDVCGKPMIQVVVENLTPRCAHRFIFVCRREHIAAYSLGDKLAFIAPNSVIIGLDEVTQGQVCTVLKAAEYIDNDAPLLTANSDQWIAYDINAFLDQMEERRLDGLIMTMKARGTKWSYARVNAEGYVVQTAEKKQISDDATVGVFLFRHGRDLVSAARRMMAGDDRVNNEFYTCPCYNYLIQDGKKIGICSVGEEHEGMFGLGTPEDLTFFRQHHISM